KWSCTIPELASVSPWSPLIFKWTGWSLALVPPLLIWGACVSRRDELSPAAKVRELETPSPARETHALPGLYLAAFGLVLALWALTCWQVRWGYFFALVFAMSLPLALDAIRWRWLAWIAFAV